ncbi:MAG: hypothetical protein OHK0038_21060 [Flammeovirgaceae bacterium]
MKNLYNSTEKKITSVLLKTFLTLPLSLGICLNLLGQGTFSSPIDGNFGEVTTWNITLGNDDLNDCLAYNYNDKDIYWKTDFSLETINKNISTESNTSSEGTFIAARSTVLDPIVVPLTSEVIYDFDSDDGGFLSGSVAIDNSWEWGTPNKNTIVGDSHLSPSNRGGKAWMTGLITAFTPGEESYVETPTFDLIEYIGTGELPFLKLDVFMDGMLDEVSNDDMVYVEYLTSGIWTKLISISPNWYDNGWIGTFKDWKTQGVQLTEDIVNNRYVQFRIYFKSSESSNSSIYDGVAFDNFRIGRLDSNDIGVIDLHTSPLVATGKDVSVEVTIKNYASSVINLFDANYVIGTSTISQSFSRTMNPFNTPASEVMPGDYTNVVFTEKLNFPSPGEYPLKISTSLTGDEYTSNDDFETTITAVDAVDVFPYYQDFEISDGSWTTDDATLWQYGATTKISSSGNAWVTLLSGNYPSDKEASLYSPYFDLSELNIEAFNYISFEYYQNLNTNDFVYLEYTDDGENWQSVNNSENEPIIFSEGTISQQMYSVRINTDDLTQFRFRFVSDDANVGQGFILKSFRIGEEVNLNVEEAPLTSGYIGIGGTDNIVYGFNMTASGGNVYLSSISSNLLGTFVTGDITSFKVYTTTTPVFNNSNLVANLSGSYSSGGVLAIDLSLNPIEVIKDQTVYVWITADVSSEAFTTHTVQLQNPTLVVYTPGIDVTLNSLLDNGEIFTIIQPSDITSEGYEHPSPISDYFDYLGDDVNGGLMVWKLRIEDFGGDGLSTKLNKLTIRVNNGGVFIRKAGLKNGTSFISTSVVNNSTGGAFLDFTGFSFEVANSSYDYLDLYVTFNNAIIDGGRMTFEVVDAGVEAGSSIIKEAFSGVVSSNDDAKNTFEVNVDRIVFFIQPDNEPIVGYSLNPQPILRATDQLGNIDTDYNENINFNTADNLNVSGVVNSFVNGVCRFVNLTYLETGNGTITISTPSDYSATSRLVNVIAGPPTIRLTNTSYNYIEDGSRVLFLNGIDITDPSTNGPDGAVIRFVNNFVTGDRIEFSETHGISSVWDEANATLFLYGQTGLAGYINMLNTMSYYTLSDNPSNLTRTIEVFVKNGRVASNSITVNITVTPVNDSPVLVPSEEAGFQGGIEEMQLTGSVLYFLNQAFSANDYDLDNP